MPKTFCERLVASFESRTERVAMRIVGDASSALTFGEALHRIRSIAWRLEEEGVAFGDRVAVIGENHPNWAVAYLGTLYRGAVCVPLDPHAEIETLGNYLENSGTQLVFAGPGVGDRLEKVQAQLGRDLRIVEWSTDNAIRTSFDEWIATEFPAEFAAEQPSAAGEDVALLIYTSGTTGTPKGVPLTHGNIVAELDGINDVLRLTDKESILSLLPLFHAYLQIVNLWVAATYGCETGYLKELSPAELATAMKEFRPTILTTVPRLWYLFHKKIFDTVAEQSGTKRAAFRTLLALNGFLRDRIGVNLGPRFFRPVHASFGGRLRLAVSGGSRFDESVAYDFHKLGFTILQGYGLTETSGAATATKETDNRVGSVGTPMGGAEVKIAEPDSEGVGEILIRGPIVFSGYYNNPQATEEAFTSDGWFRSGDLGRFDRDGHLYIVGRAKDVIVLPSGKNVHPEDLEVHYLKSPLVEELAVIGVRDEGEHAGSERLAAVVVPDFEYLRKEKIANSREAIRHALDNLGRDLPEYQRVRDYVIRAEPLPRTATRKIKRFQLKKELEEGAREPAGDEPSKFELTPADTKFLSTNIAAAATRAILQNAKEAVPLHPEMNLEIDLGLDSLARAEVFAALEHAFSTEFEADEAARALTIRNVVDLVASHAGGNGAKAPVEIDLNWAKIVREADDDLPEVRGILRNRIFFPGFAFVVYRAFNLFCRVFMRLEVNGLDHLREMKAPFLICPNHQSFLDPFVLCSNYPFAIFRNVFHVGASEFFQTRLMRFISRMLNVVPIDPDTQLMRAMKAGAIGLRHGKVLNIYPEGERAFDGDLHPFKKGAAVLATELDLPIIPVAMDGLHKVWPRHSWRIRPAKVKITIGEPFYPARLLTASADSDPSNHEAVYAEATAHLKETIAKMIDEMRSQTTVRSTP